jgi:hypothetical protein
MISNDKATLFLEVKGRRKRTILTGIHIDDDNLKIIKKKIGTCGYKENNGANICFQGDHIKYFQDKYKDLDIEVKVA